MPLGLPDLMGSAGAVESPVLSQPLPLVIFPMFSAPDDGAGRAWHQADVLDGTQLCFRVTSEPRTATCPGPGGREKSQRCFQAEPCRLRAYTSPLASHSRERALPTSPSDPSARTGRRFREALGPALVLCLEGDPPRC